MFGIPELDALLATSSRTPAAAQPHPQPNRPPAQQEDNLWNPPQNVQSVQPSLTTTDHPIKPATHILELISPPPTHHPSPAGKTSLLHLIITHAILPSTLSSIPLNGLSSAIIIIDPLSHFNVPRLAQVLLSHITTQFRLAETPIDAEDVTTRKEILDCVKTSLMHVHIFRPSSWTSLMDTLTALPEYLFDPSRHRSTNRRIHAIVLEDVDVFTSQIRSSPSTTLNPPTSAVPNPLHTASTHLTSTLTKLATLLSCNAILTSHSTTPSSSRPAIPTSWPPATQTTRLAVRRVEVVKFAPGICIEQAEAERSQRWEVVSRGRFEAWRVGGTGGGSGRKGHKDRDGGEGFVFRVGVGVEIERVEGEGK